MKKRTVPFLLFLSAALSSCAIFPKSIDRADAVEILEDAAEHIRLESTELPTKLSYSSLTETISSTGKSFSSRKTTESREEIRAEIDYEAYHYYGETAKYYKGSGSDSKAQTTFTYSWLWEQDGEYFSLFYTSDDEEDKPSPTKMTFSEFASAWESRVSQWSRESLAGTLESYASNLPKEAEKKTSSSSSESSSSKSSSSESQVKEGYDASFYSAGEGHLIAKSSETKRDYTSYYSYSKREYELKIADSLPSSYSLTTESEKRGEDSYSDSHGKSIVSHRFGVCGFQLPEPSSSSSV